MTEQSGPVAGHISREAVQILHRFSGRGPTKAKTTIGDETVTILVGDTLTTGERTLAEIGEDKMIIDHRRALQRAMRDALVGMVERHTERKVTAFMSDNHIDPDYGVEVFVLGPEPAS